ncbi:tRNA lysidine(34) synthetase TilS [Zoogloea sp.]|uniref:tRNA lysidine(34) synthetase TilS n=1 Tax=Zoogloea sp. TaxID=49181 RepID=UPI0025F6F049|nr:tRNA lysidine(34) synthetase TilS [Zoogloea sp.]MCK6394201.1 tRNA lysidine(34) synthetase TilS [Zoogloea sp.]
MPSTDPVSAVARQWRQLSVAPARLRVGLSGGLDSTVLLHVLAALRETLGFELTAIHVSHGLIPGSAEWAQPCARLCARLGVPFVVREVVVRRDHPGGLEAAAREARHAALKEDAGGALLVLAHHRDDQAETVLFRTLRGAGVRGAGGMRVFDARAGGPGIWRPLLALPRRALEAYAKAHALDWVEDPSNQDRRFSRNFLRLEVLPRIEERQPGAAAALARTGRLCAEAADLLDDLADLDLAAMAGGVAGRFNHTAALSLAPSRLRNVMRRALDRVGVLMPDEDRLCEAERQLRLGTAAAGWRLVLGTHALCVYRDDWWIERADPPSVPAALVWKGEPAVDWAGGLVRLVPAVGHGLAASALAGAHCELRGRMGGERLRLRLDGPGRSLKNLLQEAAVPPWYRPLLPLLWVDGRLAWVAGVGVAAEFRCPPGQPGVVPGWSGSAGSSVAPGGQQLGQLHR